jgi:hypothetical protein
VVGDWVTLDEEENILTLLPGALLKRGAAGEHYRQQLIAANIDHVLVVCGLDAISIRVGSSAICLSCKAAAPRRCWC